MKASDTPEYFRNARFASSVPEPAQLPTDTGAEIAFAGRSNVGKSSVINALCDHRGLARTSRTPGRTQQLVVFDLGPERRLVDLPGFGYAQVSRTVREHWEATLPRYFQNRRSLVGLVLVTDARHALKPEERALLSWCLAADLQALVVLNKSDKLSRQQALSALRASRITLAALGAPLEVRLFSAEAKMGVEALRTVLDGWLARG